MPRHWGEGTGIALPTLKLGARYNIREIPYHKILLHPVRAVYTLSLKQNKLYTKVMTLELLV
jgi:hypothetical protein